MRNENKSLYDDRYSEEENNDSHLNEYDNGTYCASVEYYNSNTDTNNSYTLNVEIENDELVMIYWPNGGWLDESHFTAEDISAGNCSFTSDKGYQYTITILGQSCSFTDSYIEEDDSEQKSLDNNFEEEESEIMEEE